MLSIGKCVKHHLVIMGLTAGVLLWNPSIWAETVEYDGIIEPSMVVDIGSPAEGIVADVAVDRSSYVEQGQKLILLESSLEQATLEKAQHMASFDGDVNLQQAQLAFSRRAHERIEALSMISTQDKDKAATEILLAEYRLRKATENRILAELELKKARAALSRRSISSPISGVVVERYVSPGEYVNSQPVLRIAQIDPLWVEIIVPSRMFGRILPGMSATIVPELPMYDEQTATVHLVDRVIDSASNTFGVRLELPNAEQKIPSGLKCTVHFVLGDQSDETINASNQTLMGQR